MSDTSGSSCGKFGNSHSRKLPCSIQSRKPKLEIYVKVKPVKITALKRQEFTQENYFKVCTEENITQEIFFLLNY